MYAYALGKCRRAKYWIKSSHPIEYIHSTVLYTTFVHTFTLFILSLLYYFSLLRKIVLFFGKRASNLPVVKRFALCALYLEVPVIRRSVVQWGIARVFPGFIEENVHGSLKNTSFSMQRGSDRCPFVFVPSVMKGPFLDPLKDKLPFLSGLKADHIREELEGLLKKNTEFDDFFGTWKTYDFFLYGRKFPNRAKECPKTFEFLSSVPNLLHNSQCGFSRLPSQDSIGNHSDAHCTNLRIRIHVPLIHNEDPNTQFLTVGGERRGWKKGNVIIFDTSFQHSATNLSEEDRYVLLFDVWNPLLTRADIAALNKLDAFFDYEK